MSRSGCCSQFDCCSHNVCSLASASEICPRESVMVRKLRVRKRKVVFQTRWSFLFVCFLPVSLQKRVLWKNLDFLLMTLRGDLKELQ